MFYNIRHMGAFKKLLVAALLLAVAAGLWTSFHYTFKAYSLDGDAAFFPTLWHGWREHGLDFFRSWNFDQDNWLFSPAPLVFLVYYVFGATGYTVLGLGWAFFVVNALLLAIITRFLLGRWPLAALVILCLGLFAGEHAMQKGLLAYIVCHNTSMAWTFIAVLTAAYGIEKRSGLCAFILACITFIAAVSDPWFNAACSLPLAMVLSVMFVKGKGHRRQSRNLLLGIAAGWALAYTRLLGLVSFLSKGSIQFISSPGRMFANVRSYIAAVDAFFPIGQILAWNHIAGTLFIIISLVLAFESLRWLALRIKYLQARQAMIAGFFLCSILIMSAAFLFLSVDAGPYRFRYLVNVYYGLLVIAVFVFAFRWAALPVLLRAAALLWVIIFIVAGAASDPAAWENAVTVNDQGASALARFLDQNGLHYGYGDYFAASADTVSWVSRYRNIVRPVGLQWDPAARPGLPLFFIPYPNQTSRLWYEPGDSKNQRRYYLLLNTGWPGIVFRKDGAAAPAFNLYTLLSVAEKQFGKPEETLQFYNCVVLVWDHPILPALAEAEKLEK